MNDLGQTIAWLGEVIIAAGAFSAPSGPRASTARDVFQLR